MKRKAAAAITATWIISMFILLFLVTIFIAGVLTLATKQEIWDSVSTININQEQIENPSLIIQRNLESVLNKEITINKKLMTLSQAIATQPKNDVKDIFVASFERPFKIIHPAGASNIDPWWIRVYEKGEPLQEYERGRELQAGSNLCNPIRNSVLLSYFIEDKRLIMCIQENYFRDWEDFKSE